MRIAFLTGNFHPEQTGIGVTATDCAKFLSELGHDVTVVTTLPYYPEWEIHQKYRGKFFTHEKLGAVTVKRSWLYVPKNKRALTRIIQELSISVLVFLRALFVKSDLLLCISPPLSLGLVSCVLGLLKRKPVWCYIKDIQPDAAVSLGMLTNPTVIGISRWMEKFMYRHSARILVLSAGMKNNLVKKGVPSEKIAVVPDSVDTRELTPAHPNAESGFREKYGLQNVAIALYSGNIGVKQNPEIIVTCAELLKERKDLFFAVVGDGVLRDKLKRDIDELGLENIALFPLAAREELADMLASADVLLLPQRMEVIDAVVPSKLLSYLCSGRPVIAAAHEASEAAHFLNSAQAGVVVPPEQPEVLAKGIEDLLANPTQATEIGMRGAKLVAETFDHAVVFTIYEQIFGSARKQVQFTEIQAQQPATGA